MARRLLDRLRPQNLLDAFGLALQVVVVVGLIELLVHIPNQDSPNWWIWLILNPALLAVAFGGHVVRCLATGKPIFKN